MEIHLYLWFYPLLFSVSRRYGSLGTLLLPLFAGIGYLVFDGIWGIARHLPYRFTYGPVFLPYWFSWGVGFYLAEIEADRAPVPKKCWMIAGCLIGGLTGLGFSIFNFRNYAEMFWALFFGTVVFWSFGEHGRAWWARRFGRILAWFGVFSYSLYATHLPLLLFYKDKLLPSPDKSSSLLPACGGIIFTILAAWVFFNLIERWNLTSNSTSPAERRQPSSNQSIAGNVRH